MSNELLAVVIPLVSAFSFMAGALFAKKTIKALIEAINFQNKKIIEYSKMNEKQRKQIEDEEKTSRRLRKEINYMIDEFASILPQSSIFGDR